MSIRLDPYLHELLIEEDTDIYNSLSDWDREFLKSIRIQVEKTGEVSEKQFNILSKIAEKIEDEEDKICE